MILVIVKEAQLRPKIVTDSRSLENEGISLSINILTVGLATQKMCTGIWKLF